MSQSQTAIEVHDYGPAQLREFRFRYNSQDFVLVEAKGKAVIDYRDSIGKQVKVRDRTATNDGAAKFEPLLLSQCVYQLAPDGQNRIALTADWCRALPNHIFKDLFSRLEKMSGLAEDTDGLREKVAELEDRLAALEASSSLSSPQENNGEHSGNVLTLSTGGGN